MNARLWLCVVLMCCVSIVASGDEYVWVEGESPASLPDMDTEELGLQMGPWSRPEYLSDGQVLNIHLPGNKAEELFPEGGIVIGYEFNATKGGAHDVWARSGYEFARSEFDWRIDDGEWTTLSNQEPSRDLMDLSLWNPIGWIKLGEVRLEPGRHTMQFRHPVNYTTDNRGNKKARRTLHMLDCVCLTKDEFDPHSKYKPGENHMTEVDRQAAEKVYKLPSSPTGKRSKAALNGLWQIARWDEYDVPIRNRLKGTDELPDLDTLHWYAIETPGEKKVKQHRMAFAHRVVYRTRVDVPADMADRGWVLEFQQFNMIVSVFVNGQFCDWSKAHDALWLCDVSDAIEPGRVNEVAIVLKDRYYALDPERSEKAQETGNGLVQFYGVPGRMFENSGTGGYLDMAVATHGHGDGGRSGLMEPITLIATGPVYTHDVFCKPSVKKQKLDLEITLRNPGDADARVTVDNEVVPWSREGIRDAEVEKFISPVTATVPAEGTRTIQVSAAWSDPDLWWPDDPNLYLVRTRLLMDGRLADTKETRFGFREWGWDGELFTINGGPWQFWADTTKFESPQALVEDAKTSGRNLYRFWGRHHWPGMTYREVMDYFDENGIVVRDSSTFDGEVASYGQGLTEKGKSTYNHTLFDNIINQQKAWVRGARNHPCILIWSLENEITYVNSQLLGQAKVVEPAIRMLAEEVMETDPSRPVMVDGGNALAHPSQWKDDKEINKLKDLGHLPVNGCHYYEFVGWDATDYPDAAYSADQWYDVKQRGWWPLMPGQPTFHGELFYGRGRPKEILAIVGGEQVFAGDVGTYPARDLMMRMMSEGYRWSGVSSAWHFWTGVATRDYYTSWQPVALLCREWNTAFGGGSNVVRTLKLINQTSQPGPITAKWELRVDGDRRGRGSRTFQMERGGRIEWQIDFEVPHVRTRQEGRLILTAERDGREVFRDEKTIHVIPTDRAPKPDLPRGMKIYLLDRHGAAARRLRARGIDFKTVGSLDAVPEGRNLLVVGRDSVPEELSSDARWQKLALSGARILVLEQAHPLHYQSVPADFEVTDHGGRVAFMQDAAHPVFEELGQKDFFCWSGDHMNYENAYRKPTKGAKPLVQCDYGLDYSALAECQVGDGLIVVNQLLVGRKLDGDPVAQRLFDNLVNYAAEYEPVRKDTAVTFDPETPAFKMLDGSGVEYERHPDPLRAMNSGAQIVVVQATPENLRALVGRAGRVHDFTENGGWLMLWGVTSEGIEQFNKLVGVDHLIRPHTREKVLIRMPRDPLTAGISLRDVVMTTGERIARWKGTEWRSTDGYSYVVDYDDVAPFCTIDGIPPKREASKMPAQRHVVNGLTTDEFWMYLYYIHIDEHEPRIEFDLPRPEVIEGFSITCDTAYYKIVGVSLYFDDDPEPVKLDLRPDSSMQKFKLEPRRASKVTVEFSDLLETHERPVLGINNIGLKVRRSEEFYRKVDPLLNIGALVKYPQGDGGILLNQVNVLEQEENPANRSKKAVIVKQLLANLGARFGGGRKVVVGTGLRYDPISIEDAKYTAYMNHEREPGWFRNRRMRDVDFSVLPLGEKQFAGVLYDIYTFPTSPAPNVLMLSGSGSDVEAESIESIEVGRKADALFFLHTYNPEKKAEQYDEEVAELKAQPLGKAKAEDMPESPHVLTYVVRYADGKTEEIEVKWREDIGPWFSDQPRDLKNAALAWTAPIPEKKGWKLAAYTMQWNNPRRDVAIESIDLKVPDPQQTQGYGAPALLAITAATAPK